MTKLRNICEKKSIWGGEWIPNHFLGKTWNLFTKKGNILPLRYRSKKEQNKIFYFVNNLNAAWEILFTKYCKSVKSTNIPIWSTKNKSSVTGDFGVSERTFKPKLVILFWHRFYFLESQLSPYNLTRGNQRIIYLKKHEHFVQ